MSELEVVLDLNYSSCYHPLFKKILNTGYEKLMWKYKNIIKLVREWEQEEYSGEERSYRRHGYYFCSFVEVYKHLKGYDRNVQLLWTSHSPSSAKEARGSCEK